MTVSLALSNGSSVVAWQSSDGVQFQEFDPSGVPIGTITGVASGISSWLSLAALGNGGFSVIWDPSAGASPMAQDYSAGGISNGSAFTLTSSPPAAPWASTSLDTAIGTQSGPWTALLPDGDTVVVTNSNGGNGQPPSLTMQQYDPAGNPVGGAYVHGVQGLPGLGQIQIAPLANGNYAVSFVDDQNFGGESFVDLFSPSGNNLASQAVATTGFELLHSQVIAGLADGGFAIGWVAATYETQDISNPAPFGVYLEEFGANGSPITQAQLLGVLAESSTSTLASNDSGPQIVSFADGQYTVSWVSNSVPQSQTFTERGAPVSPLSSSSIITPAQNYAVPTGVTEVTLVGTGPQVVTANNAGDTLVSNDTASTLIGGTGNDTLIAGHDANVLTGGGGGDTFVFPYLPWNAGQITDFNPSTDKLDLSGIFHAIGYTGSNPIADGYLSFVSDGHGNTLVEVNTHQASNPWPTLVTTLDGVSPSSITPADYGLASGSGGGSTGTGGGTGTSGGTGTGAATGSGGSTTVDTSAANYVAPDGVTNIVLTANMAQTVTANNGGDTITSNDYDSTLIGGTGNDTLIAGHDANTMTGGGGDDTFVFNCLPWNNTGHITDFNPASDKLDLSGIFQSIGYIGSNPIADGYLSFTSDGHGNTLVEINAHNPSQPWSTLLTTLDGVAPSSITPADYIVSPTSGSGGGTSTGGGAGIGGDTGGTAPGATVDTSAANYTAPDGVTNIVLTGSTAQIVMANNQGDTITSNDSQSTLIGGTGNDTLIAGHNSNTMTGGGGDDTFVFNFLPWNSNGAITDFNPSTDVLDLTGIFNSIGYTGSDAVTDGYLSFVSDGHGNTLVEVNTHSASDPWPTIVTTLQHVNPSALHVGDWMT